MRAKTIGMMPAPHTPWTTRKATSAPRPGLRAHAAVATAKPSRLATSTRRRPNRSPAAPPMSRQLASGVT